MTLTSIVAAASAITAVAGAWGVFLKVRKWQQGVEKQNELIKDGQRCLLRAEMLRIYYRNRETGQIRQYEYENFFLMFNAYRALDGNSFMIKIADEVREFDVIP